MTFARVNNVPVMGKYTLTPEVIRREKLLNMSAMLFPKNELPVKNIVRSQATASAKILFSALRRKKLPQNTFRHLGNVVSNVEDIAVDIYRSKIKRPEMPPDLGNGGWSSEYRERPTVYKV